VLGEFGTRISVLEKAAEQLLLVGNPLHAHRSLQRAYIPD